MTKFGTFVSTGFLLAAAACAANAKSSQRNNASRNNIYRLGISPILPDRTGKAEAWVETFSVTKEKRSNNQDNDTEPQKPRKLLSKTAFALSIAFLTGFADVFAFRMNRCYANMMTGNTIKMASALGEFRAMDALHFAAMLLSYALGGLIYRSMVHFHALENKAKPHVAARASASPLMLAMFAWSDLLFYSNSNNHHHSSGIGSKNVIPLALGFGLLNAATTDSTGGTITFAMTGHVSKLSQALSDWLFSPDPRKRRFRSATKLSAKILSFFVAGVVSGTVLATAGSSSNHIVMEASGMTLPSFLVGEQRRVPIFSIVGVIAIALIQLYDRALPNFVFDIASVLLNPFNGTKAIEGEMRKETHNNKLDMNINLWPQSAS